MGSSPLDKLVAKSDFKTANIMSQYLAAYGIDHHTRSLARNMPLLVKNELPFLRRYIDSRLKKTAECKALSKGILLDKDPETTQLNEPLGVCVASYCLSAETEGIISTKNPVLPTDAIPSDLEL